MRACNQLLAVVMLTAGIAQAEPPTVTLVRADGDPKITDLLPAEQRRLETVKSTAKTETARASVIVSGNEVRFVGPDGETLKKVQPPTDMNIPGHVVGVVSFGRGVAYCLSSLHAPGSPYDLVIISAKSEKRLKRAGHTICSISVPGDDDSGAQYLGVMSVESRGPDPDYGKWRTEVFREDGEIEWEFPGVDATAVAVRGDRAVAVRWGRPCSIVRTANRKTGKAAELKVDNAVLNKVAFLSDDSAMLLWGGHDTVLADVDGTRILWKTILDHQGGAGEYPIQLNSNGGVSTVSGTLSMVARKRIDDKDRWQVRLYSFDIKTGAVVRVTPLFEQEGQDGILLLSRRRDGDKERLTVGSREYELTPRKAGQDGK